MDLFAYGGNLSIAGQQLPVLVLLTAFASVVALLLPLLRWAALPKPIPGIPYNKLSANRILGDVPDMTKTGRVRFWMREQFAIHQSPIYQIFVHPFTKPWIMVADFREAQDVMMRRLDEFDKSTRTVDSFAGVLGSSFISMKSSNRLFKHNKDLLKDLMTSAYLNEISAPEIYEKMMSLLDLWKIKTDLGNGRPFKAHLDIHSATLDIMMAVTFDYPQSDTMVGRHIAHLKTQSEADSNVSQNKPVSFSEAPLSPELDALVYLTESIGVGFQSILPRIANWVYLQRFRSKKALRVKKELIRRNIENSLKRLTQDGTDHEPKKKKLRCAVDQILLREIEGARKNGVRPNFHKSAIYDELFGYIAGGTDTTSTTLEWWVKCMTKYQHLQSRLRNVIYEAHPAALAEDRLPTIDEVTRANIPYLEAVIEETLRYVPIVSMLIREATVDTQILGYPIPKGTMVFFCNNTASFLEPSFGISEEKRSVSSREAKDWYGAWDPADIGDYKPERWLKMEQSEKGGEVSQHEVFDARAGPMLSFGSGPRSCFGRKLAYVELRITITLLIWTFEFLDIGESLNGFEALDAFTVLPQDCYVKLRKIEY